MAAASCLSSVKSAGMSFTREIVGRADAFLSIIDRISECAGAILPGAVMAVTSLATRKETAHKALHHLDLIS
ncbi:MAG: hypothetical protein K2X08_00360 [Chlamydiales bacterium]|nr:hypothetical protein [Chlamydiales bacterium]